MTLEEQLEEQAKRGLMSLGLEEDTADTWGPWAALAAQFIPGVGEGVGVDLTRDAIQDERYGDAAIEGGLTLLGAVPIVGDFAAAAIKGIRRAPTKEIKKLSPEDAEEWLRNNPRPEDPAELNKWYKRKYRAGATGKQSTEVAWNEKAWIAANPAPDFGGVRVKDLSPEQTREWKNWHSRKSAAKHKSTVSENARNFHRNNPNYQNERRAKNSDEINRAERERYANDPEYKAKVIGNVRRHYASLPADVKAERAARAKQQLQDKIAAMSPEELSVYKAKQAVSASKRRAGLLERTPSWANQDEIDEIYQIAQEITRITGVPHDVDHIIPLLGYSGQRVNRTASGLHTPDNLLVVPKLDNLSKGAKFVPGSEVEPGGVDTARGLLHEAMDELGLIE